MIKPLIFRMAAVLTLCWLTPAAAAPPTIILENQTKDQITVWIHRTKASTWDQPQIHVLGNQKVPLDGDKYPPGVYQLAMWHSSRGFIYSGWKDFRGHMVSYNLFDPGDTGSDFPNYKPGQLYPTFGIF